jgi:AcrR family transcriptional regulator
MKASKRSAGSDKRRADILKSALSVFAQEGFHRADVQVIADGSGVGKGTVYRHFGNKEELFLATAKFCVEQLGASIEEQLNEQRSIQEIVGQREVADVLRRIAIAFARFYEAHPHSVEIMIQERAEFRESVFPTHLMHREETRAGLDELISAASTAGEFRQIEAKAVTDAMADLLFGSVVNGCLAGSRAKLVERVTQAIDIFLWGVVSDSAIESRQPSTTSMHGDRKA